MVIGFANCNWVRGNMKNSLSARNLVSSTLITVMLIYFMTKTPSPKIVFLPFLVCSISMAGKSIAQLLNKKKCVMIFHKLFIIGFLLFWTGGLIAACYISIRDKTYSMLVFLLPFWLVGIYWIKNKLLNKRNRKNGESVFAFGIVINIALVTILLLAGIILLILGIKDLDAGLIFAGVFFSFGAFTFVLAVLTIHGYLDKMKIDVLGMYIGILFVVIGIGFIALKYRELGSLLEMIRFFGLWIIIPIMMTAAGVIQIVKCLRNRKKE